MGGFEQRVYRHRCVEAWSMVVPWDGFPLAKLVALADPKPEAKFVTFTTFLDPKVADRPAPGRSRLPLLRGPATGRGEQRAGVPRDRHLRQAAAEPERRADPPRDAVEVRLQGRQVDREDRVRREAAEEHVAGHGLERIRFLREREPARRSPALVAGQRARHRRRGLRRRLASATLPFNGYEKQVAALYAGLDLAKNY